MTGRRAVLRALRIVYLLAAAGLLIWLIADRRAEIGDLLTGTRLGWLVGSLVMSFGMLGLAAEVWRRMLVAQGETIGLAPTVHATARAVLARYIPGSVWFALGRATLLSRLGVRAGPLTVTATTEIILSISTTIAAGVVLLGLQGALPGGAVWAIAASIALVAIASPAVSGRLIEWIARTRRVEAPRISWSDYLGVVVTTLVFWLWSALTFVAYLRAFPISDGLGVPLVVGGFLFAWGVGFLAFVAPQGLGVFELTLASLLVNQGVAETVVLIGGYRVVILVRDAIAAALAETMARKVDRYAGPMEAEPS